MHYLLRYTGALLAALLLCPAAQALDLPDTVLAEIDAHALAAPPEVEKSTQTLAAYLTANLHSEPEKVRAIYRWITDRIDYDVPAYLEGRFSKMSASDVLAKRTTVCDGFASLFEELSRAAGLEVKSIAGFAKGYVGAGGQHFDKPNHMWNALKVDGEWRMIDSTWGAGYVSNGRYKKALSEAFFLVPPEQLVFSHFPQDDNWQLQHTPHLTQKQFERLPEVKTTFFNNDISPVEAWETLSSPEFSGQFVQTFDLPYHIASVQKAPLSFNLKLDHHYIFRIRSSKFEKMAVMQTGKWLELGLQGDAFAADIDPAVPGQLLVVGKAFGSDNYTAILGYDVTP